MKLQLNEKTLNAYLQRAINEEIDELFGSRVRKQSQRMITGQGWGNQKRAATNGWGAAANSDISATDAESDTPQTLVGMITKMEQGLQTIEQAAGINSPAGNLAATVTGARGVKGSLLAAINALTQIANRLNAVERKSGSNAIMENAGDYMDASVGAGAVAGNAWTSSLKSIEKLLTDRGFKLINGEWVHMNNPTSVAAKAINSPHNEVRVAAEAYNNIVNKTGYWGRQAAKQSGNVKRAWQGLKDSGTMIANPQKAQSWANGVKNMKAAVKGVTPGKNISKARAVALAAKQGATTTGTLLQWPLILLSIADEAARQAAQGRQRNIVRTYNAAAVLARRMGNILQDISDQTGGGQEQEVVTEINVSRGKKSFSSIEQGMQALSQEMRRIGGATQGSTVNRQDLVFDIPQGIDLNTPEGVKAFQEWVNTIQDANGNVLITDNEGQPLVPDGKWGPKTNAVYDKIAQMIQQTGPVNEGLVMERKDIETALANLERAAGTTGPGGNAYSNISAMSGGDNASRLQNAQNIKNIIRTYPPVLNQYLNVLADAGAEVSGIQPLNVDTRPHRNYSINELTAIDNRIQELLQIAQNTQTPEGEEGEQRGGNLIIRGTLPPKPVRRPNPNPTPQPTEPEEPKRDFNRDFGLERITPGDNLTAQAETDSYLEYSPFDNDPYKLKSYGIIPNNKSGRITKREIKEKIKTAEAEGKLTHDQATELLRNLRMDYKNGVGQVYQNSDGSMATTTRTADKRARDLGLQTSNIEQPAWVNEDRKTRKKKLNERQFKELVKRIISESLR